MDFCGVVWQQPTMKVLCDADGRGLANVDVVLVRRLSIITGRRMLNLRMVISYPAMKASICTTVTRKILPLVKWVKTYRLSWCCHVFSPKGMRLSQMKARPFTRTPFANAAKHWSPVTITLWLSNALDYRVWRIVKMLGFYGKSLP